MSKPERFILTANLTLAFAAFGGIQIVETILGLGCKLVAVEAGAEEGSGAVLTEFDSDAFRRVIEALTHPVTGSQLTQYRRQSTRVTQVLQNWLKESSFVNSSGFFPTEKEKQDQTRLTDFRRKAIGALVTLSENTPNDSIRKTMRQIAENDASTENRELAGIALYTWGDTDSGNKRIAALLRETKSKDLKDQVMGWHELTYYSHAIGEMKGAIIAYEQLSRVYPLAMQQRDAECPQTDNPLSVNPHLRIAWQFVSACGPTSRKLEAFRKTQLASATETKTIVAGAQVGATGFQAQMKRAENLMQNQRLHEAAMAFDVLFKDQEKALGTSSPELPKTLNYLGACLFRQSKFQEALDYWARAAKIGIHTNTPKQDLVRSLLGIGWAKAALKSPLGAEKALVMAVSELEEARKESSLSPADFVIANSASYIDAAMLAPWANGGQLVDKAFAPFAAVDAAVKREHPDLIVAWLVVHHLSAGFDQQTKTIVALLVPIVARLAESNRTKAIYLTHICMVNVFLFKDLRGILNQLKAKLSELDRQLPRDSLERISLEEDAKSLNNFVEHIGTAFRMFGLSSFVNAARSFDEARMEIVGLEDILLAAGGNELCGWMEAAKCAAVLCDGDMSYGKSAADNGLRYTRDPDLVTRLLSLKNIAITLATSPLTQVATASSPSFNDSSEAISQGLRQPAQIWADNMAFGGIMKGLSLQTLSP